MGNRFPLFGVIGATGSGKTTFARLLSQTYGFTFLEEPVAENPYLERFYKEPTKWCLASEKFFLEAKVKQLRPVKDQLKNQAAVIDPPLWMDAEIYPSVQKKVGWLSEADFNDYQRLYKQLSAKHKPAMPDLIFYIDAPVAMVLEKIKQRADSGTRFFESWAVKNCPTYFTELVAATNDWVTRNPYKVPIVRIDKSQIDFYTPEGKEKLMGEIILEAKNKIDTNSSLIIPFSFERL